MSSVNGPTVCVCYFNRLSEFDIEQQYPIGDYTMYNVGDGEL